MPSDAVGERSSRPLLTLGRVDLVRIQVGYRAQPDGPAHQQFLLDLSVPEPESTPARDAFGEAWVLAALEPVLYGGTDAPRHYSVHAHRWHTSWGPGPGALEIGLLVTAGTIRAAASEAWKDGVARAFRALMEEVGLPEPTPTSRAAAVTRARRCAGTAYALDPETLTLSSEEHHRAANSWTMGLRAATGDEYDVVVGLVDGYAGSVRVRHVRRTEIFDSVGSE